MLCTVIEELRLLKVSFEMGKAVSTEHKKIGQNDLRCENVMLTKNLEPKVADFNYARPTDGPTTSITKVLDMVRWLAPEKLADKSVRYNAKCEIFGYS